MSKVNGISKFDNFFFDDIKCFVSFCVGYIKSNLYRLVYFFMLLNSSLGCCFVI